MPLNVIKASAGSGKTFELTQQFLSIVKNSSHSNTLAVTFTNKATDEMKVRIVEALYAIAHGVAKQSENRAHYTANEAAKKLSQILHDYSRFQVSTIDGFYQKILRSFVRELGIYSSYSLLLNPNEVLAHSLDELLLSLERPEYQHLYNWLLDWAKERIRQGEDWNIKNHLLSLGMALFAENVSTLLEEYAAELTPIKVEQFSSSLREEKKKDLEYLHTLAKKCLASLQKAGVDPEDSSHKMLTKLAEVNLKTRVELSPTFLGLYQNTEKAFSKDTHKHNPGLMTQLQATGFDADLDAFIDFYQKSSQSYFTAEAVLKSLDLVPVLIELNHFIDQYLRENNEVLLSSVNQMLRAIISDCDAPFIYEKLGYQLQHYMLDEFQDTSTMQWENFKPLIEESLSKGYANLVVGDIKQSIYRWRNSDWRILGFKIAEKFPDLRESSLPTNWRSDAKIIAFNNLVFKDWAELLDQNFEAEYQPLPMPSAYQDLLTTSYAQVEQQVPEKAKADEGWIKIQVFPYAKADEKEQRLEKLHLSLLESIQEVIDKGYRKQDIALLVRGNKEGVALAEFLLSQNIPVVSSESLLINHSPAVRLLVAVIGFMSSIDEDYFHLATNLLTEITPADEEELKRAAQLPLLEAVECYIRILQLNQEEQNTIYLQSFQDIVADYVASNGSDARSFLAWWAEEGVKKTVATNQSQDAIQIMTIHKSKGLAFDIVMMPYCDWSWTPTAIQAPLLWCKTKAPYDGIPVVPVEWSTKMAASCFHEEYFQEKLYQYVDNLNTLYVAFTRAKHGLYIFSRQMTKEQAKNKNMFALIHQFLEKAKLTQRGQFEDHPEKWIYTEGKLAIPHHKEESSTAPILSSSYYTSAFSEHKLKLRLQAETTHNQREGSTLHQILQFVVRKEDLPTAIDKVIRMGRLLPSQRAWAEKQIKKVLDNSLTETWFNGTYEKVLNEASIIAAPRSANQEGGSVYRPDRVLISGNKVLIVDYKFGQEEEKYNRQILGYMNLLKDMHQWETIEGCLYYHLTGEVKPVRFPD